jgi:RNA polymerase sigma factor (sigma-70 family)
MLNLLKSPGVNGGVSKPETTAWDFDSQTMPYVDSLYNTAYRMTGNSQDAEDLVQETFFKAYKYYDKFEEGTNLKAWLFKILKNTFINNYRKKKLEPKSVEFSDIEDSFEKIVRHDPEEQPRDPDGTANVMDEASRRRRGAAVRLPDGGHFGRSRGLLLQGDRRDPRMPGWHGDVEALSRAQAPGEGADAVREDSRIHAGRRTGANQAEAGPVTL